MKKLIPIIVLVAVVGFGAYYLSSSGQKSDSQMSSQMDKSSESSTSGSQMDPMATGVNRNRPSHSPLEGLDEEDDDD
ncbi:MAG: hypothetical protein KDD42_00850, partial [Bdellovibrionales bacterium]|nr:hypothetical protein [Bdellovibrionales bacterium]